MALATGPSPNSVLKTDVVLVNDPGIDAVTFTVTLQLLAAITVPPANVMVSEPATAVTVPPEQELLILAGLATVKPAGITSVKPSDPTLTIFEVLLMSKVNALGLFNMYGLFANDLLN
jgi:hypothetical protein